MSLAQRFAQRIEGWLAARAKQQDLVSVPRVRPQDVGRSKVLGGDLGDLFLGELAFDVEASHRELPERRIGLGALTLLVEPQLDVAVRLSEPLIESDVLAV